MKSTEQEPQEEILSLLRKQWHPTKNENLTLDSLTKSSVRRISWICEMGHEWEAVFVSRVRQKSGCPYCAGKKAYPGFNDLATVNPELAELWHPTLNLPATPQTTLPRSGKKVWWFREFCGHSWQASPDTQSKGKKCPVCEGKQVFTNQNDLAFMAPALLALWDYGKNKVKPTELFYRSQKQCHWVCSEGHQWEQSPSTLIKKPQCPFCANGRHLVGFSDLTTVRPDLAAEWHPTKNGLLTPQNVTKGSRTKVWWQCAEGHEWEASISDRHRGTGCPVCVNKTIVPGVNDLATKHPAVAAMWSKENPDSPDTVASGSSEQYKWECSHGHSWYRSVAKQVRSGNCQRCSSSQKEEALLTFVKELAPGLDVLHNSRKVISPFELDIYIPEKNLAVEFNGLYWHTESQGKDKWYHYKKWEACKEKGIQLIQIWEDDWDRNPGLVKSMLSHKLGFAQDKAYARQTRVEVVTKQVADTFLLTNHIQGAVDGSTRLGLYLGRTLVAVMVLKDEPSPEENTLNLLRFATSRQVVGGFTKLINYIRKRMPEVAKVVTFSDNCVSDGGLYKNNGFVATKQLPPDYMYVVDKQRYHKFGYRLKRFRNDPALVWQEGLTEKQLAELNGLERVWDAGKTKWELSF